MATPAAAPTPSHPAPRRSRFGAAAARRHNPLWRRTDSLRSRLRALLVLGLVASAGLSVLVALALYQDDRSASHRYAATLHQVQAVAVSDADQQHGGLGGDFSAVVRWTDPSGKAHQTRAAADPATLTGDKVAVWLDSTDQVAAPPTNVADSAGKAVVLGSLALVTAATLVSAMGSVARSRLNQADIRNWDREWEKTEPAWTRRK
jgi:hypothetical protein